MKSVDERKLRLISQISHLKKEVDKLMIDKGASDLHLKVPSTTESHLEMKEGSDLGASQTRSA